MAMFLLRNIMEMVKSGTVRKLLNMHCSTCLLVRSLVKFFGAFKNSQEDVSSEILLRINIVVGKTAREVGIENIYERPER